MPSNNFRLGEMLNKRSPNSKTWINFDGSYTTEIYQNVVHFEDYEGNLHNIDTDLFDEADLFDYDGPIERHGKNELDAVKERVRAEKKASKMNRDNYDFQGLKVPFVAKLPRNFKRGYKIGHGSNNLKFKPVGVSPSKGYVDEDRKNCIHYQDAWNDADVCLELTEKGIKETIIIKTDRAPNRFSFEVNGSLEDDLTAGTMKLEPAWLEDAEGTKRDVLQTIRREGEYTFIDLEADVEGLVYPIYIDPTVTVQPDPTAGKDAYFESYNPTSNYNGASLWAGRIAGGETSSLIQFDLSSIPSNALVTSAIFSLYQDSNYYYPMNITCHEVTGAWGETTLTYNNKPTYNNSVNYGLQFANTGGIWRPWNITSLVNSWVNGSKTNYGLYIKDDGGSYGANDRVAFYSSDHTDTARRPKLEINYNTPPTAPQLTAPNGGETWNSQHTINWTGSTDLNYEESTVVNANYSTINPGGRKLTQLSNGWIIAVTMNASVDAQFFRLAGDTVWLKLTYITSNSITDVALTSVGNIVHALVIYGANNAHIKFDATTVSNTDIFGTRVNVDTLNSQSNMYVGSIAVNPAQTELHAAWISKNATLPNSKNIRYAKYTIATNTWSAITQITTLNGSPQDYNDVNINVKTDGNPIILASSLVNPLYAITAIRWNGSSWVQSTVYSVGSFMQSGACACVENNGVIHVVWVGRRTQTYQALAYSKSTDGGATWSTVKYIALDNESLSISWVSASISVNANGKLFVVAGTTKTTVIEVFESTDSGVNWAGVQSMNKGDYYSPNALLMPNSTNNKIVFMYREGAANKVIFWGFVGTPSANLQYHIQLSTNNGGSWSDIVALTSAGATSYLYDFISRPESSLCKVRIRAYDGSVYGPWDESNGVFTIVHNQAPTAPTNLSPNGITLDRANGQRFSWTHNDPNSNDPQSKFDLQWRLQGSSTWNDYTGISVNQFYDFVANNFPRGNIEWRVRTYDQAGLSSPYSNTVTFLASDKPTAPTIVSPGSSVAVANPTVQWSSDSQVGYLLKVTDSSQTVVFNIEKTSTNKAQSITTNLLNQKSYTVELKVRNGDGLYSDATLKNIDVSYTPPAIPSIETVKGTSFIEINIIDQVPTGTQPNVLYHEVYKEVNNEFVLMSTNIQTRYRDYLIASNEANRYFVRTVGSNGTFVDTITFSEQIALKGVWLHIIDDPDNSIRQFKFDGEGRSSNWGLESAVHRFQGRKNPVIETGVLEEFTLDFSLQIVNEDENRALELITTSGQTVCYRDGRGRKVYGVFVELPLDEQRWGGYSTKLSLMKIDFYEGI